MSPAEYVRVALAEYRRRGVPFMEAWTRTLQSLPRNRGDDEQERLQWVTVLKWSRRYYHAAYEGIPAPRAPRVVVVTHRARRAKAAARAAAAHAAPVAA